MFVGKITVESSEVLGYVTDISVMLMFSNGNAILK